MNFVHFEVRRPARIDQEYDGERLVNGGKISNSLFDSIIKDVKIAALKIGDIFTVPIHHAHRHSDQSCVDLESITFNGLAFALQTAGRGGLIVLIIRRGIDGMPSGISFRGRGSFPARLGISWVRHEGKD